MLVTLYHYLESCNKKKVYSHLIGGKSLPSKVLRNCLNMCPPYIKKMAEEAEQQVLAPTTCLKVIGWKELFEWVFVQHKVLFWKGVFRERDLNEARLCPPVTSFSVPKCRSHLCYLKGLASHNNHNLAQHAFSIVYIKVFPYVEACIHSLYSLEVIKGSGSSLRYCLSAPVKKEVD